MTNLMKMKRNKQNNLLMVIDGSNQAYKSYYSFKNLNYNGVNTGMTFGFLRNIWTFIMRFKPNDVVVIFDTAKSKSSNFRNKLLPTYKEGRNISIDRDDFNRQQRLLKKVLRMLGIKVVWDKVGLGHETDDYIAWYVKQHQGKVLIISDDKDFCQLLSEDTKQLKDKKLLYPSNCKEIMGVEANQVADFLILVGDSSDNIKGYRGIGQVKGKQFLEKFGSIKKFLRDETAEFKGIDKDGLIDLYERNECLINLNKALKQYPIETIPIIKPKIINVDKLNKLLNENGLSSFTLKDYLKPFKELEHENYVNRPIGGRKNNSSKRDIKKS